MVASDPLEVKRAFSAPVRAHRSSATSTCSLSVNPVCRPEPFANPSARAWVMTSGLWPRMLA
jgi:hypothetical protein